MVYACGGRGCAWPCTRFPLLILLGTRRLTPFCKHDCWGHQHCPDYHLRVPVHFEHVCSDPQPSISIPKPFLRPNMASETEDASSTLHRPGIGWINQGRQLDLI